jgi:PAP2 superfamily protein
VSAVTEAAPALPATTTEVAAGPRWVARGLFLLLAGLWAVRIGVPADRVTIFVWLWLAAVMWRWGVPLRSHLDFARDWWPAFAILVFWTYSRGLADNLGAPIRVTEPIAVDGWLGLGELPTQRLQQALCAPTCADPSVGSWYDTICTATYLTHFVTGLTLALVLWLTSRRQWAAWLRRYLTLNLVGLAICVAVPMQPPWMASMGGHVHPGVDRLTGRGGSVLGVHVSQMVMGPIGNQVAAMPSLHAGTACLVALFAVGRLRSPWRFLALAYPLMMGFTLVYFGEHYVVDVLAGYTLAVAVHTTFSWWERRRSGRDALADPGQGRRGHDARPRPAYVAGELAVLGDDHDHPAGRLGRDQLPDHVVGDHPARAEEHLDPSR